ncbi:hypothetical protein HU200_011697 [Digitaria exilis]|uniref:KIB1-4 beta-propeller domain-containing protein n=1 Tax=Digitaria exilis TaxID=1010633 RepID=A0A835KMC9_9POAL|nr:hypothetical protein HU200_011697 [Digitaria exilis]
MSNKTRSRRQQKGPDADADATPIRTEETGSEASGKDVVYLPPHLVDGGILWYLSALEYARFANVCKPWSHIVARRLADPSPHLFAFRSTATHRRAEVIAVPLGSSSSRHVDARATPAHVAVRRVTRRTECVGATASGRLVLANSRRTVLFNPVTGTFRRINKVPGLSYNYYTVNPMPVVPLAGDDDSFFLASGDSGKVGIWCAADGKWTVGHVDHAESFRMAALCGDSVYALDAMGSVFKVELPSFHATELAVPSLRDEHHMAVEKGYLVEAGGEVLFVWPLFTITRVRGKRDCFDPELFGSDEDDGGEEEDDDYFFDDVARLSGFEVYRLDMAEEMRWVKEDRLAGDDVALFVSRWSSFSVRASEKGCVSNCVYFVCDEGGGATLGAPSRWERGRCFRPRVRVRRQEDCCVELDAGAAVFESVPSMAYVACGRVAQRNPARPVVHTKWRSGIRPGPLYTRAGAPQAKTQLLVRVAQRNPAWPAAKVHGAQQQLRPQA